MGRMLTAVSVLVLLCVCSARAKKDRQWQTGKLLDVNQADAAIATVAPFPRLGRITETRAVRVAWTYVIDAGEYLYESQEIRKSRDRTPPLTVNGPVQFVIEKDHVYIRDEEGKEHDTKLVKKTLKASPGK